MKFSHGKHFFGFFRMNSQILMSLKFFIAFFSLLYTILYVQRLRLRLKICESVDERKEQRLLLLKIMLRSSNYYVARCVQHNVAQFRSFQLD
jgi:hypothetical protein